MTFHRIVLASLLLLPGCASERVDQARQQSEQSPEPAGSRFRKPTDSATKPATKGKPRNSRVSSEERASQPTGGGGSSKAPESSSGIEDPVGDPEASSDHPPGYTDLLGASISKERASAVIELVVASSLPRTLRGDEVLSLTSSFRMKKRSFSVYADGTESGWQAYMTEDEKTTKLQGSFSIDGPAATFEIPWVTFGERKRFRWSANTAWTLSSFLTTDYAFDSAPDFGKARFPAT